MKHKVPVTGTALLISAIIGATVQSDEFDQLFEEDQILIVDDADSIEIEIDDQTNSVAESSSDQELLIIEDEDSPADKAPEISSGETVVIEQDDESELLIEDNADIVISPENLGDRRTAALPKTVMDADSENRNFTIKFDEFWTEIATFMDSGANADNLGFLHTELIANWQPNSAWEIQLSGRMDGYYEYGDKDIEQTDVDYGESFVRYSAANYRITLGTQTIIWGRIDEFPPSDRLSTQDFSRFILDDLSDRRRANPAIRYEYFSGSSKLDIVALPNFRAPELPDIDSVWFPANRQTGEVIGLNSTPVSRAITRIAPINLDEPDSDGGFGVRFSNLTNDFDYAVTFQNVRQNSPYLVFNPSTFSIDALYPRSRIIGGDIGFEALGGTVKLEAAWQKDTPVTEVNGDFITVESISWGAALELFPGDGDARLNLQLTGQRHFDAPAVLNRTEVYAFNGTWEIPFANDKWKLKTRFYFGIGESDSYLNPEISYTGLSSQELYLETHLLKGSSNTPGGFHEDHSLVAAGWRIKF